MNGFDPIKGRGGGRAPRPRVSGPARALALLLAVAALAGLAFAVAADGAEEPVRITPKPFFFSGLKTGESSEKVFTIRSFETGVITVGNVNIVPLESADPQKAEEFEEEAKSFAVVGNGCTGLKLAESEFCEVTVSFQSASPELMEAELVVESSVATATARLRGEATGVELRLPKENIDFGTVAVNSTSAPHRVRVRAIGNTTLTGIGAPKLLGKGADQFEVTNNECDTELAATNSCVVEVVFKPTIPGPSEAELQMESSPNTAKVGLAGVGELPSATLLPLKWDFGDWKVGEESLTEVFTLTNTAKVAPLTVKSVHFGGPQAGDFLIKANSCPGPGQLLAGESCEITVVFKPENAEPAKAFLIVESDAANGPPESTLEGEGKGAKLAVEPEAGHDFGEQLLDTAGEAEKFIIRNVGSSAMRVESIKVGEADFEDFSIDRDLCEGAKGLLQATGQCAIEVTFAPTGTPGAKHATLEVKTDGGDKNAPLTGTAIQNEVTFTPTEHDFKEVTVESSSAWADFTLENSGSTSVTIESIGLAGSESAEFEKEDGTCGTLPNKELPKKESCTIKARFHPGSKGAKKAQLRVLAGGESHEAELKGTGT